MTKDEIVAARRTLLAREISSQGLSVVAKLSKKPDRQINDMAAGRKSFGDGIAKEIGPLIRPDLSRDWLVYPDLLTSLQPKSEEQNVSLGPDVRGRIPLISWVKAGTWSEVVDIYEPGYAERWLPFLKNNGENVFALRVEGDSMTARFGKSYPDGCIIFVDPDQRMPTNGDRIVAKLVGSQKTTFKSYTEDAGRKWLRPLNDSHPPIYDEFFVIGKVIGKWEDD